MVDRLLVVDHAVERRHAGRAGTVVAVPAVGRATGDGALGGLQPGVEVDLPGQRGGPVRLGGRRLRVELRDRGQRVRRERVLVTAVVVAGADPPGPVAAARALRAAPRVVPGQQVVGAVLAGAGRTRGGGAAGLLEVLVVHGIPQVVAHLRRVRDGGGDLRLVALLLGPLQRPVGGLDRAGVGVGGVGVAPLLGVRRVTDEDRQEAAVADLAEVERLAGRVRDGLPHGLLRAALIGVDVRRPGRAVAALAEAVDVVHVDQPVHAVHAGGAVCRLELRGQRVRADLDRRVDLAADRRVLTGQVGLGRVVRRVGRVVVRLGVVRDDVLVHDLPRLVERRPVLGHPAVLRLEEQPVAERLGRGLVTVVRRLDEQRLDRVVGHALGLKYPFAGALILL